MYMCMYVMMHACVSVAGGKHYIELTMKFTADDGSSPIDFKNKPLILCDSESSAQRVSQAVR